MDAYPHKSLADTDNPSAQGVGWTPYHQEFGEVPGDLT